ncbi:hypothetical protein Q8A73_009788 [Channa argus]|nr:hypothetical protein Q8A73_009788 [Channa argus]
MPRRPLRAIWHDQDEGASSVVATPEPHLPLSLSDSPGRIHHLVAQSGCQSAVSQGTLRRLELERTGLKPPQPQQQLCGRQREVRRRCGSLEPTEGMADFNVSHICYSTFSWEEEAGP